MLVLTQAGIGGLWFSTISAFTRNQTAFGFSAMNGALILVGIAASIFHLGRPLQSWRAFMGVRRSWLSREIVALNALAFGVLLQLAAEALPTFFPLGTSKALLTFCSLLSAVALLSSIMVYVDTPRIFWNANQTVPRFLGTTLLLGVAAIGMFANESLLFALTSIFAITKLAFEIVIFKNLSSSNVDPLARSARLMSTALKPLTVFRFVSLLTGGVILAQYAFAHEIAPPWIAPAIFILLLVSELAERSIFFRAVAQPKMPGGVT